MSLVRDTFGRTVEQATREGYPDPIAKAKEAIRPLKEGLPGFCGSGIFKTRKDTGLVEHSGILVVDVDNFSTVEALQQMRHLVENDPHIQAAFVSPSGTGLKALIRIRADRDSHRRSFLAAQRHFRERYSVEIDNCGDLSRLCFVSHDPDTFVRGEEAVILEPLPPTPPNKPTPALQAKPVGLSPNIPRTMPEMRSYLLTATATICATFTRSIRG